jgi:hypothetical protein
LVDALFAPEVCVVLRREEVFEQEEGEKEGEESGNAP